MRDRQKECNILVDEQGECYICHQDTHDLDLAFESWLCWPECHDKLWAEYVEAERRDLNEH